MERCLGQAPRSAFRVLLVEDDAIDARLVRASASAFGSLRLTFAAATSVAEAQDLLARSAADELPFDLCITDFWLGHESSLRLIADLRARDGLAGRPLPVIVLTSLNTPEIQRLCLMAGALAVIGKEQISTSVLETAIAGALGARTGDGQLEGIGADPAGWAGSARGPEARAPAGDKPPFLDRLGDVMRALDGPGGALAGPAVRPGAMAHAFAALSETARFGVIEQASTANGSGLDLAASVAEACALVAMRGRPVHYVPPTRPMPLDGHESILFFVVFELVSRVSEVGIGRGPVRVRLEAEPDAYALHVSGSADGGAGALPVTLGALFKRFLRESRASVATVREAGGPATLTARFARPVVH